MGSRVKRALVIEGGGFRAAYATGAVYRLLREAPDLHFDVVAANSSSVIAAAYFVTQQVQEIENIWLNDDCLASPQLLSYWRVPVSWKKSFLNIDYLFDEIFSKRYPLNLQKLRGARTDFFVTVMRYPSGERCQFSNRDPEIYEAMRASCAVPWAYLPKIVLRGQRYIDGFYDSIPLRIALEQGCNEIWIISTRPKGYRKGQLRLFEKIPLRHCQLLAQRHIFYNETAQAIETNDHYKMIRPQQTLPISRFTNNMNKLREVFKIGMEDMKSVIYE